MKMEDIKFGRIYKMANYYDGNSAGTEVEVKWPTRDGKFVICNPVSEPDMQSSMALRPEELEEV